MCFYEQTVFSCGDWKWGCFRDRCAHEHRTGETCGLRLIHHTEYRRATCHTCKSIETKKNRRLGGQKRIEKWRQEGRLRENHSSIMQIESEIQALDSQIAELGTSRVYLMYTKFPPRPRRHLAEPVIENTLVDILPRRPRGYFFPLSASDLFGI